MCESISSNHHSVDTQLSDAVGFLLPEQRADFVKEFPEWERLAWSGSWIDTDKMGVDDEWSNWAIDWIEANTAIQWIDGEPYDTCDDQMCEIANYEG